VATSAVLASVGIRFPKAVGQMILPLLSSKYTIQWEGLRFINEHPPGKSLFKDKNDIHDNERMESDNLPHRKLYKGLNNFIIDHLIFDQSYKDQIFNFLDLFHNEAKGEKDIFWLKTLSEIDVRKWEITTDPDQPGKAMIAPKFEGKVNNFSAYASLLLLDLKGFNAEAGIRYNHHKLYGNNATYSFNPSYNIDENTRVFVNISSAYKIPSIYQLYDGSAGNKNLKPEESTNYEVGVQSLSHNKMNSLRFVAFKRDIKNVIVYYTDINYNSQYINRDQQNDYGFEIESNISIGKRGNWINNLTYVDGQGKEDNVKVNNLYRRPNFTFNSTLTLQPCKDFTLMPSFRFVGTRLKGEYDPGPAIMPQYYTLDLYTAYNFTKQFRAFLDLRNITDQKYFDVPGYNSRRANYTIGLSANF